jgi:hypothetical protein
MRPKPEHVLARCVAVTVQELSTCKHSRTCPSTNAELIHSFQGCKAIVGVDTRFPSLVQLVCEDVQHKLAIALCVDMPVRVLIEEFAELRRIDQVAVVGHADTVRAVDVKGLSLGIRAATCRWVSKVAESHEAREVRNTGAIVEDLGGHSVALALVEATASTAAHDACRILSAMLEKI